MFGRFLAAMVLMGLCLAGSAHAATKESAPVAVVILPPQATVALDQQGAAAAELLCDELAAALARDSGLRVVDRTQIEKVLAEKRLDAQPRPALAYDAMLRVCVNPLHSPPAVNLEVIDLSAGNVVGVSQWPWTIQTPRQQFKEMAAACGKLIRQAPSAGAGRAKVRLLGVSAPEGMARIQPLRQQLEAMLVQTAEACPSVRVVGHLEAMTTKEESLLLLLGHARLGDGREFAPQADVLVEAQIQELNGAGKTFEETAVRIRLRAGRAGEGQWKEVQGLVRDWAKLAPQACGLLAGELGQARPEAAAQQASDMLTRRAQAEAELAAVRKTPEVPGGLERLAAAAKLDPTYAPAAVALALTAHPGETRSDVIQRVLQFLERFPAAKELHPGAISLALRWSNKTVPDAQDTERLRRIVEIGMAAPIENYEPYCGWLPGPVYEGMKAARIEPAYRLAWLEQVRARVDVLAPQVGKIDDFHRGNVASSLLRARHFFVGFAFDCGRPDVARGRLREFMADGRAVARDSWGIAQMLRETVAKMGDAPLLAEYDRWMEKYTKQVMQILLEWNDYPVYDKTTVSPTAKTYGAALPLTIGPKAIYAAAGVGSYKELIGSNDRIPSNHTLICVRLDDQGRPAGPDVPLPTRDFGKDMAITGATVLGGKLYVGTKRTGLLVYDLAGGKWEQIGPEQGLVDWYVFFVHALDDKTLLVVAGDPDKRVVYCTLEAATGKLALLHRLDSPYVGWGATMDAPLRVWREGEQVIAMNYRGLAKDILRQRPQFQTWLDLWPQGWRCQPRTFQCEPTGVEILGGRRFAMSMNGLHEIDAQGKVLRSWWNRRFFYAAGPDHDNLARSDITPPGDFPGDNIDANYRFMAATKSLLFLVGEEGELLGFDPATETWHGPFRLAVGRDAIPLGQAEGVFVGGTGGMAYVSTADFLAAAKEAGRVMTVAQVRQRKEQLAEQAGPLEAAKFDLLHRNFQGAKKRIEAILAAKPDDPQALQLMAVLHDFWCLNKPDEALGWYGKLGAMADPSCIHTGLYGVFRIHFTLKHWEQAIAAGELLLEKVPCLGGSMTSEVERFMGYARRDLTRSAKAATAPAPG